ncbi:MAG TPA: HAD family hydrolase [Gemmatimonadota bacterium]|nr:HAD family hydrolase [Gemmatimonadota bacterium]
MPAAERLILFDIDGTLLTAGGAPRRAFRRALTEFFGTEGAAATDDFSGKTDPQIVYDLMTAAGFGDNHIAERIAAVFESYVAGLAVELETETGHRLLPGVSELVSRLAEDPRVVLGLVTGNVETGARLKLNHFGLWDRFRVGAFGSDDRERDRLPPIAVERARELTGRSFVGEEVVVVGDTPADVRCARAAGAISVAVATGPPGRDTLAASDPDFLLDSLEAWPEVAAQIGLEDRRIETPARRS